MIFSFTAFCISLFLGYQIIQKFLSKINVSGWLVLFLAPGVGFALTALFLFLELYVLHRVSGVPTLFVSGFLIALISRYPKKIAQPDFPNKPLFIFIGSLAVILMLFNLLKAPYGTGVDVWALWKLKARFLFYDSQPWEYLFQPTLNFSCVDYPLFYPLIILWGWLAAGSENLFTLWGIAFIFTLSLIGLLMTCLMRFGQWRAGLAGLFLISTPHFIGMASSQYAELILAYFILASVVVIIIGLEKEDQALLILGGFLVSMAAFVKNEGNLWALCVLLGLTVGRGFKVLKPLLLGAIPIFFVIVIFKWRVGVSNEKMSWPLVQQALQSDTLIQEAVTVVRFTAVELIKENSWIYSWIFIAFSLLFRPRSLFSKERFWILASLILLQMGFVAAYLVSPLDITSNLKTSLDRLLFDSFAVWTLIAFISISD